jgi:thioredoxin-like negative regulator of GroEL
MTTKTIPEYLEDERRKHADAQIRLEEEAAHIQASHTAHRRTAKQPDIESPRQPKAAVKTKITGAQKTRVTRKAAIKARKKGRK